MWFKSPGTGSAGAGLRICSPKLGLPRKGKNNYTERRRGTQLPMARVWSLRDLKVAATDASGLVGAGFSLRSFGSAFEIGAPPGRYFPGVYLIISARSMVIMLPHPTFSKSSSTTGRKSLDRK